MAPEAWHEQSTVGGRDATPSGRWVAGNKKALRIGAILLPLASAT